MDKVQTKFRTRLKEFRELKDLSRMDIVRKANMAYPTVQKWEEEPLTSVRADNVQALCDLLECSQEDLIYTVTE